MKRVTGIGGIFFQAKDPVALRDWYQRHLGLDIQDWGGAILPWTDDQGNAVKGMTVWSAEATGGDHFAAPFMINYRVHDLAALRKALADEGCEVLDKVDEQGYGKFGWVMDPEGNKVELWEPPEGM